MKSRDRFTISDGNLKVLETIPKLMKIKKYRTELRKLVLDFLTDETIIRNAIKTDLNNISRINRLRDGRK